MADTWQTIMSRVETAAKTILVTNGYRTNIGQKTYLWPKEVLPKNLKQGLAIRDISDDIVVDAQPYDFHELEVEFVVVSEGSATPDTDWRKMVSDVREMIGTNRTWGGAALDTRLGKAEAEMEAEDLHAIGAVSVKATIIYRTDNYKAA